MLHQIKAKLRRHKKILKFSKRYLKKYFLHDAIDPTRLQSGEKDWDLTLFDFLSSLSQFSDGSPITFLTNLSQGFSERHAKLDQCDDEVTVISLLWVLSHYISAPASSHGLCLAYIGEGINPKFIEPLELALSSMPTSVKLNIFDCINNQIKKTKYQCGGVKSSFESDDLSLFNHADQDDRNCAFVIDTKDLDSVNKILIEKIINGQRAIAYLVLITKKSIKPWVPMRAKDWDIQCLTEFSNDLDLHLCTNLSWQEDIIGIRDLRFKEVGSINIPNTLDQSTKVIPLVPLNLFDHCLELSSSVTEFISGAQIETYALGYQSDIEIKKGKTPSFFTEAPVFYEAYDVCVSGAAVVWRDGHALAVADLAHDRSRTRGKNITVNEPNCVLKGEYFLAITNNPHHSHLIHETLQHLHFIASYAPNAKLLLSNELTQSQREYLSSFGFDEERCVYRRPDETYQIEKLYFRGPLQTTFDRSAINYMRLIGSQDLNLRKTHPARVYFSRRDARVYRNLINELEIESIFRQHGFEILMPSELSAKEKIEIFANARYIAGALGAAFTYAPFANNAQFIILTSSMYFPVMFPQMAALQLAKLNYIRGIGLKHFSDVWGYEHCSFYLPPKLVSEALSKVLSA